LARLLKAPGQELGALDLVSGSVPRRKTGEAGAEGAGHEMDAMSAREDRDPILSRDAKKNLMRRARELEADLANVRAVYDEDRYAAIRAELEAIAEAMHATAGMRGRDRTFTNEHERARQAVSQSIGAALCAIEAQMPRLRAHLRESLHLGHSCTYNPRPRLNWDVIS
jgi:hypothetical protein